MSSPVAETSELFDYAPIMLRMEALLKQIHTNYLAREPERNRALMDQLVVEARLLRTYNDHKQDIP